MPVASVRERRSNARHEVSFGAALVIDGTDHPCRVKDISVGGAKVQTGLALNKGQSITLRVAEMGLFDAVIMWRNAAYVGLKFAADPEEVGETLMGLAVYA